MGCVASKGDLSDSNPRVFCVFNVDDLGNTLNPGRIEVTETDLILYQRGKEPIRWPVRCLRRYGFDQELFSFESGRRCPTGPGIYAFKCKRAEGLFNILQECVQNSGQEDHSVTHGNQTGTASRPSSVSEPPTGLQSNGHSVQSLATQNFSRMVPLMNGGLTSTAQASFSPTSPHYQSPKPSSKYYVNDGILSDRSSVVLQTGASAQLPSNSNMIGTSHEYVNTACMTHDSLNNLSSIVDPNSVTPQIEQIEIEDGREISYALLDLPQTSSQTGETKNKLNFEALSVQAKKGYQKDVNVNYAKLDDLLRQEHQICKSGSDKKHFYANIAPENGGASKPKNGQIPLRNSLEQHYYANINVLEIPKTPQTPIGRECNKQVHYIMLDLDKNSDTVSVGAPSTTPASPLSLYSLSNIPESPCRRSEGYATIDFDRTAALSNSANRINTNDDSLRKTRHNSTISELF